MTDVKGNGSAENGVEMRESAPTTGGQDGPLYNYDRRGSKVRVSEFILFSNL
jgi:hypothetical protein